MPNPIARTKSVGAKVTEEEYSELEKLAIAGNLTLGEWCRQALLARLNPEPRRAVEEVLLAEILGTRMIVLNAVYALANGERLNAPEMQEIIRRVDEQKDAGAVELLARKGVGRKPEGEGSR